MSIIMRLCILFLLLFVSCSSNDNRIIGDSIQKTDSIVLELGLPLTLEKAGDFLFISDIMGSDYLVQAYDVSSNDYLFSFLPKGNGPKELSTVNGMGVFDDCIYLFDLNLERIYSYKLIDIKKDNYLTVPSNTYSYANKGMRIWNLNRVNKGFVATGVFDSYKKFAFLNDSLDVVSFFGKFRPKPLNSIDDNIHIMANLGMQSFSKDNHYMADILYNAALISLYEIENNNFEMKWEYVGEELSYEVSSNGAVVNKNNMGYISVSLTTKFVYALYSGEPDDVESIAPYGQEIHKLDISTGEIVGKYKLGRRCFSIETDEESHKLFVLSHLPEPVVLIYDLPE